MTENKTSGSDSLSSNEKEGDGNSTLGVLNERKYAGSQADS